KPRLRITSNVGVGTMKAREPSGGMPASQLTNQTIPAPMIEALSRTASATRLRPGVRYQTKAAASRTTVKAQRAVARQMTMAAHRMMIRGSHLRGGEYVVCATPMAVYTSPKLLQAKMISGPMLLLIITMAGEKQYRARAT